MMESKTDTTCINCGGSGWIYKNDSEGRAIAESCPVCRTKYMLSLSGVPHKYISAQFNNFPWENYKSIDENVKNIITGFYNDYMTAWKKENTGLYIYSHTRGCGKTFLASSLINSTRANYSENALFISAVEYFAILKNNFDLSGIEKKNIDKYFTCDLLCIDDLGAEKYTEWMASELFRLLDNRYLNGKITIFTSNNSIDELPYDDRIKDRIYDMCINLHLPEEDVRRYKAIDKKKKFIEKMGYT